MTNYKVKKLSSLTLKPTIKRVFYTVFLGLFITGCIWLYLMKTNDDTPTPTSFTLIKIHGALAMAALLCLGMLIPLHIQKGLKANKNVRSGLIMIVISSVLVMTGYALYYSSSDILRNDASLIHTILGIGFPVFLILHIFLGRNSGDK